MAQSDRSDNLIKAILIVLAIVVLSPVLTMGFAMPMMGMMGGFGGQGGMFGSGTGPVWGFGISLVWLIILALVGYFIYQSVVGRPESGTDSALEELRLAYARGDLSDEEFEQRRARLTKDE